MAWRSELDAVDQKVLPPDPDVMSAIGLSHDLTSAVADLVDNSIDAGASSILIRIVLLNGKPVSFLLLDNGRGMSEPQLDQAMTVGKRRTYAKADLGFFGMGLKAASFSQADVLTVVSRTVGGSPAGRRWRRDTRNFTCDVIDQSQAGELLDATPVSAGSGTVVRWDGVREFPSTDNSNIVDDYLARTIHQIRAHLGTTLHQILAGGELTLTIDAVEATDNRSGPPQTIEPIDPFGYRHSGDSRYPKTLLAHVGDRSVELRCHIWPGRSEALGFKLGGNPETHQGLYFYRNRRLLEVGGWKGAAVPHRRLRLARVAVDVSPVLDLINLNMEKSAVQPKPELVRAIEKATDSRGTTFSDYLRDAETAYRMSNVRDRKRTEVVQPGDGIAPEIKRAVADELPIVPGRAPLAIRWKNLHSDDLFEVDRQASTLWLNQRFRGAILSGRRSSKNDAPLLKAALYLLLQDVFRGQAFGSRE
ncbi:ATP-binding protein, partial [Pseudonocardia sp.]|uniref:ATP-binding protein n=1 Tax=Pseudonocardia sp. TaxID=60912 RepID=UPI002604058A